MEQETTTELPPALPFRVWIELNPHYTAKGEWTEGIRLGVSGQFESPKEAAIWMDRELKLLCVRAKEVMRVFARRQRGEE